jgi:hypothetical protein
VTAEISVEAIRVEHKDMRPVAAYTGEQTIDPRVLQEVGLIKFYCDSLDKCVDNFLMTEWSSQELI